MATEIENIMSPFQRAVKEGLTEHRVIPINPTVKGPGSPTDDKKLCWVEPFCAAIAEGMGVTNACAVADVHPTTVHQRRRENEQFRDAWNRAAEIGTRLMEQEAQRRAYHGTLKPVYQKGECVGHIREFSDTLMIFLLKARRPDKYREGVEDGGRGSTVVNITVETKEKRDDPKLVEVIPIEVVTVGDGDKQDGAGVCQAAPVH